MAHYAKNIRNQLYYSKGKLLSNFRFHIFRQSAISQQTQLQIIENQLTNNKTRISTTSKNRQKPECSKIVTSSNKFVSRNHYKNFIHPLMYYFYAKYENISTDISVSSFKYTIFFMYNCVSLCCLPRQRRGSSLTHLFCEYLRDFFCDP